MWTKEIRTGHNTDLSMYNQLLFNELIVRHSVHNHIIDHLRTNYLGVSFLVWKRSGGQ